MLRYFIGCMLLLGFMFSCGKDDFNDKPDVTITAPGEGLFLQVLDTIIVSADYSDDVMVETIEVKLVDENFSVADNTVVLPEFKKSGSISIEYVPQDVYLPSGQYYIEVKALDGEKSRQRYVSINIGSYPLVWEGLLVATNDGAMSLLNTSLEIESLWDFPFTFTKGVMNNVDHQFYVGNSALGQISTVDQDNGNLIWEGLVSGVGQPGFFKDMVYSTVSEKVYAATTESEVMVYSNQGVNYGVISVGNNNEVESLCTMGDYLFVEVDSYSQSDNGLMIYYTPTANLYNTIWMSSDIVKMVPLNDDELLILANNEGGNGILSIYSLVDETLSEIYQSPDQALSMVMGGGQKLYLSMSDGVYRIDMIANQIDLMATGSGPTDMVYDVVHNVILTSEGNTLRYFNSSWTMQGEHSFSSEIKGIYNIYNK